MHALLDLEVSGLAGLPLWIDVLCINQSDLEEIKRQTRQLKEVYSRAEFVVGQLGPETPGDESDCADEQALWYHWGPRGNRRRVAAPPPPAICRDNSCRPGPKYP